MIDAKPQYHGWCADPTVVLRAGRLMNYGLFHEWRLRAVSAMTVTFSPVIFLPGAGGGAPDLEVFRDGSDDATQFEIISYPNWRRYVADGLSAEDLIAELEAQVIAKVPQGPIRIIGSSIGGHFGYALGL